MSAALPSSLSRNPQSGYTFSSSPSKHRITNPSANSIIDLKPRVRGRSLSSRKPNTARCLHPPPRPGHKLSPAKDRGVILMRAGLRAQDERAAICQHGRYPRCEFRYTLICQNSRDNTDSIHPGLTDVLNKACASPIYNCHLPLYRQEKKNPEKREDPNFGV